MIVWRRLGRIHFTIAHRLYNSHTGYIRKVPLPRAPRLQSNETTEEGVRTTQERPELVEEMTEYVVIVVVALDGEGGGGGNGDRSSSCLHYGQMLK